MGNWSINIRGVGPHHNAASYDVEQLAARFVEKLKAGHSIQSATVTTGGEIDLQDPSAILPLKDESAK